MKTPVLFSIMLLGLIACSYEGEENMLTIHQLECTKWILYSIESNISNAPPATGRNLPYQESYVFLRNNEFIKTRLQDGVTTEASGTFRILSYPHAEYVELTFKEDKELIRPYSSSLVENLGMHSGRLSVSYAVADGPTLTYKNVTFSCP